MRLRWVKWSALPIAVLMVGTVAMAQDQTSSQGSRRTSGAIFDTSSETRSDNRAAERKSAGPHRERREERATDRR